MNRGSRNWCFTLNNYTDADILLLDAVGPTVVYLIYGKELAPDTGTPHLQGFICFADAKSLSATKKVPGLGRAHLEIKKGTFEEASDYCKKEGDFKEYGSLPMDPKRKGEMAQEYYRNLRVAAEEGRFDDIEEKVRFTQIKLIEHHNMRALKSRILEDTTSSNLWYWGSTGTGKSRKARTDHPEAYLKMCNKWWDGYRDEETVLIEDFDKNHDGLCHHMKIWGDRYPFIAEKKGDSMKIRPQLIIVTSNYHPSEIWSDPSDLEPILRRFACIEFKVLASV